MALETQKERLKEQEARHRPLGVVRDAFRVFARKSSIVLGSAWSFAIAILIILIWGLNGSAFHYFDIWQLATRPLLACDVFAVYSESVSVALLLAAFGSGTLSGEVRVTVSEIDPVAVALMVPVAL